MADDDKKDDGLTYEGSYLNTDLFSDTQLFGSELGSEPYKVDTSSIDQALSVIDAPAGGDIYDKRAALYRQEVLGGALRSQKNLDLFMGPTMNLLKKQNERLNARFQMEWDSTEKIDTTNIFGELTGNEMPITDEIIAISKQVKADMRAVQLLPENSPERRELRRRIQANQNVIVQFNEVNKNLFAIRNDMESNGTDVKSWSEGMSKAEIRMWHDIYNSDGKNMKVVDDGKGGKKVIWDDPGAIYYDFGDDTGGEMKGAYFKDEDSGNQSPLGVIHEIRNKFNYEGGMEDLKKDKEAVKKIQKALLEVMPNKNLGTTGENGDGVDGDWGDLTQAAYSKYFHSHKDLEKDYFNKNMDEGNKKAFMKRSEEGQHNIDLATISQTPPVRELEVMALGNKMEEATLKMLQNGNSSNEIETALGVMYDGLDIQQQKSLLFDGAGSTGKGEVDTNKFIESLLYAQTNLMINGKQKDYSKMSKSEQIIAVDNLKGNGMLKTYINPKTGEEESLRDIFKDYYMDEVTRMSKSAMPHQFDLSNNSYVFSLKNGTLSNKRGNKTPNMNKKLLDGEIGMSLSDMIQFTANMEGDHSGYWETEEKNKGKKDYKIKMIGTVPTVFYSYGGDWKKSSINMFKEGQSDASKKAYAALVAALSDYLIK